MLRALMGMGLIAAGLPGGIAAQEPSSTREACTWESASPVSIEELTAEYERWDGECVRVKAVHAHSRYATQDQLLADRFAVLETGEPSRQSLIFFGTAAADHEPHRPRWEEVLGRFGSCTIAYDAMLAEMEANPGVIMLMGGLCHHTLDHYLAPVAFREIDGPALTRLRREEVGEDRVRLAELASDEPGNLVYRRTADRMFAALEQRDFDVFLELIDPNLFEDLAEFEAERRFGVRDVEWGAERATDLGPRAARLDERRGEARAEFDLAVAASAAVAIGPDAETVLLVERVPADMPGFRILTGSDPRTGGFICRLRRGATRADLPVREADIDNDPSRPYFCVWAGDFVVYEQGTVPSASVPWIEYGFAEVPE